MGSKPVIYGDKANAGGEKMTKEKLLRENYLYYPTCREICKLVRHCAEFSFNKI